MEGPLKIEEIITYFSPDESDLLENKIKNYDGRALILVETVFLVDKSEWGPLHKWGGAETVFVTRTRQ